MSIKDQRTIRAEKQKAQQARQATRHRVLRKNRAANERRLHNHWLVSAATQHSSAE